MMRSFKDLSLQRKLFWLVGLAAAFSGAIGIAVLIAHDATTFRPRAIASAAIQVEGLADVLTAAVEFDDHETAQKQLEALARQPSILGIAVVLEDGRVFAQYSKQGGPSFREQQPHTLPPDVVDVHAEISSNGRDLATVHLVRELRPFRSRIVEYGAFLGAGALSLLTLAVLLSIMLRRSITAPVETLAHATEQVAVHRDYRLRVATDRSDEVGQLAARMNEMLAAIDANDTRLRASEETARRQLAEIENLYDNSAIGLLQVDRDLRFVRINRMAAELGQRRIEDIVGHTLREVTADTAPLLEPLYRQILETGESGETDHELPASGPSGGKARFVHATHFPLRDASGRIVGVTCVTRDVTEQRRVEAERTDLETQLRQSQKMQALGTLAGGIAHDFNNVLAAIGGNARLALEDLPGDHPAALSVGEISRAAARAKDLVRRILAFSRQGQMDRRPVALADVIEEVLRLLRATLPTTIELRFETASHLPPVLADASQVHQVLMNLGTNAADAMRERGGLLTVRLDDVRTDSRLHALSPELAPGRYVRLRVIDTGVGMTRELLEHIFDPFFTTKAPGEGTGLGLSMVHGIMRSHGGAVLVDSEPGRGTTFDLYFPVTDATAEPGEPQVASAAEPRGRGEHILYVDDEEALVFLVVRMMQRMGYRITGLQRAQEAIAAVRAAPHEFDLVISDLGMPGMNGMDLAVELLRIRPDLPVIITSGYVRSSDLKRAEEIGVRDVILKPGTVDEMSDLIRRRLDALVSNR